MSTIPPTSSTNGSSSGAQSKGGLNDLDLDDFLKLMISELQNQDPLDPTKNSEMLQQIGQIRSIAATDQLSNSLDSLQQNQGISTASSLIGKQVQALDDDGYVFFGVVKSVQLSPNDDGTRNLTLKVNTGEDTVDVKMEDIFNILPANVQQPDDPVPDDTSGDGTETGSGTGSTTDPEDTTDTGSTDPTEEVTN